MFFYMSIVVWFVGFYLLPEAQRLPYSFGDDADGYWSIYHIIYSLPIITCLLPFFLNIMLGIGQDTGMGMKSLSIYMASISIIIVLLYESNHGLLPSTILFPVSNVLLMIYSSFSQNKFID